MHTFARPRVQKNGNRHIFVKQSLYIGVCAHILYNSPITKSLRWGFAMQTKSGHHTLDFWLKGPPIPPNIM